MDFQLRGSYKIFNRWGAAIVAVLKLAQHAGMSTGLSGRVWEKHFGRW